MEYVFQETGRKKQKKAEYPFIEHLDVEEDKIDEKLQSLSNDAPKLHLFFDVFNSFELGEVSGDREIIHLQAGDVVKALMTYIAIYWVFQIGFHASHANFLGFFQRVLFDIPFDCKSLRFENFMDRYRTAADRANGSKMFKKFAV